MYNTEDRYDITAKAMSALSRLKQNKNEKTSVMEHQRNKKVDYSKFIFEEFDDDSYENKIRVDSLFYKVLLSNLDESYCEKVRSILTETLETARQIYEKINIKPKIYGFNSISIMNESDALLEKSTRRIINEFINQRYYSISNEQRENLYLERSKPIARKLILDHDSDYDEAVKFATKTLVVEDLIHRINFPQTIWGKIEELKNDNDNLFNQDHLISLIDTFENQIQSISKIVAAII